MFRTRRSSLIKCLTRLRIIDDETPRAVEDTERRRVLMVHSILKRLGEEQLESLLQSVETRGAEEPGSCVVVSKGDLRLCRRHIPDCPPHIIFCQLWRWPDVSDPNELKKLVHLCGTPETETTVCCNPYHWTRLCRPESPPPPYCEMPPELLAAEASPSEVVSQETIGSETYYGSGCDSDGNRRSVKPWCNIAYWEMSTRVGRLFPVFDPCLNVFTDLPQGNGLCLETLAQGRRTKNHSIIQTRVKIGQGMTLCRDDTEVWIYNRSNYPIFVNSPTLDPPNTRRLTVYKVLPGFSIKIFDYEKSRYNAMLQDPDQGPFDPHAVRVSFAKGFGTSKYSRQFITSCPCWLEVIFMVNR